MQVLFIQRMARQPVFQGQPDILKIFKRRKQAMVAKEAALLKAKPVEAPAVVTLKKSVVRALNMVILKGRPAITALQLLLLVSALEQHDPYGRDLKTLPLILEKIAPADRGIICHALERLCRLGLLQRENFDPEGAHFRVSPELDGYRLTPLGQFVCSLKQHRNAK